MNVKCLIACLALSLAVWGCGKNKPDFLPKDVSASEAALVQRGSYLVEGLAACGYCHSKQMAPREPLIGGRGIQDYYGSVSSANLTPHATGLKEWKLPDIVQALRLSLKPDGSRISYDVHKGFEWLSDQDAMSIAVFLSHLKPIKNEVSRREVGVVIRNTKGILETRKQVKGYIPPIPKGYSLEYGRYLVDNVARCGYCHTDEAGLLSTPKYLGGGKTIRVADFEKSAPDISASKVYGIGDWTKSDIVKYLQTGIRPNASQVDEAFCPTNFYRNASRKDLMAMATYLSTVK